jgi:hypothetical protein
MYSAYHDLNKHVLEFTKVQLSCDIMCHYKLTIPQPGKCCSKMFEVVLYWYEQIKQYSWLTLIGLLPVETLCLLQNAVEDVIVLEYMKLCDDSKTSITDPLTYQFNLELREPENSSHNKAATDGEYSIKMDTSINLDHTQDRSMTSYYKIV